VALTIFFGAQELSRPETTNIQAILRFKRVLFAVYCTFEIFGIFKLIPCNHFLISTDLPRTANVVTKRFPKSTSSYMGRFPKVSGVDICPQIWNLST
jgi:hypothetical protein